MMDIISPRTFGLRLLSILIGSALCVICPVGRAAEPVTIEFNRDIRPILSDNCFKCHGPDKAKRKANLRLDTEEGALADLGERRAIVPGDLAKSALIERITAADETERMPPVKSGRKLSPQQVDLLRRWVAQGAKWQKHWAFLPPQRPTLPKVNKAKWVRNPIDAFVLARLEREGLSPSVEAEKTTLIRRVTLDLTGLPPTLAEVDAFLFDNTPNAYETVVDRLLASPRYGEHMAVAWLDAARYADSNGYQGDNTRTMWPWRDWLIRALNENMPFDQFTVEQIAGDLLPGVSREQQVATGFHRNHMINGEGGRIDEESRVDYVVDRVDTTATVWLGLTLGCCRCHDHKYDPFTQKEYYQLFAYFNNIAESGGVDRGGNAAPVLSLPTEEQTHRKAEVSHSIADYDKQLKKLDEKYPPTQEQSQRPAIAALFGAPATLGMVLALPDSFLISFSEREPILKKRGEARKALDEVNRSIVQTMVMEERQPQRDTFILIRGQYDKYGDKVSHDVPAMLSPLPKDVPANRLALAKWLVDPANPLTARVTVNRVWQHYFGSGLVKTTEDFGVQGEAPSHPELLDWLAVEFRESGWNVKALHKLIVSSATYRQASKMAPALRERDPENHLLARGPRHRLSSMVLRDQALSMSGLLVEKLGGPPVKPYQPPGIWEEMSFGKTKYVQDKGESLYRHSLYTFWRRAVPPTMMFDIASRQVCTVRSSRTNTPLHALTLLNDVTYVEASRVLAERLLTESSSDEERTSHLFRLATARKPSDAEKQVLARALERLRKQYGVDKDAALMLVSAGEKPRKADLDVVDHAAYTGLVSMVLNLDEVISKE